MARRFVMRLRRPRFTGGRTPVATPAGSARRLVALGVVAALLAALVWAGTTQTFTGQRVADLVLYGRFATGPALRGAAADALGVVSLTSAAIAVIGLAAIALARGRFGLVVALVLLVGGANLTAQALKEVLERPNLIGPAAYAPGNSFPSGTVALAATIGFACVLVAPRPLRAGVALGTTVLTAAVGISTIATGWHRLADVVGAILIALAWASIVTAVLVMVQGWMPRRTWARGQAGRATGAAGLAGLLAIAVGTIGLAASLVEPVSLADLVTARATSPEAFLAALAIAAGTALLAAAGYVLAMGGVAFEIPG